MILTDLPYGTTANKWDAVIPFNLMWPEFLRVTKPTAAMVFTASQPFTSALVMSRPDLFRHEWIWQKNCGSNFLQVKREPMKEHESVLVFSRGKWTYNQQRQVRSEGGAKMAKITKRITATENYGAVSNKNGALSEDRCPSSIQKFNRHVGLHPTQKPVELMRYMIRTYTNPGETVLDATMGSGTTGVAAVLESRRFIGIERDPKYFTGASVRIYSA